MFAIHSHGDSENTKIFKHKSYVTGDVVEFTPERGMITVEGVIRKTGETFYNRVSRRDFLLRADALSREIWVMKESDEKRDQRRLLDVMVRAAKAAKVQGDPFNPRVCDDILRERPSRLVSMGRDFSTPMPPAPRADMSKAPIPLSATQPTAPPRIIVATR